MKVPGFYGAVCFKQEIGRWPCKQYLGGGDLSISCLFFESNLNWAWCCAQLVQEDALKACNILCSSLIRKCLTRYSQVMQRALLTRMLNLKSDWSLYYSQDAVRCQMLAALLVSNALTVSLGIQMLLGSGSTWLAVTRGRWFRWRKNCNHVFVPRLGRVGPFYR